MLGVLVSFVFSGMVTQVVAQGVCVPPTLKIAAVHGKVIRTYSKGEEVLDGVTITVRKENSQGTIVAKVITDEDGCFTFQKIRPGKYVLVVEKPLYITFVFPVQVKKSSKLATKPDEIVINLGADYNDPCGGSFVELRERQP